MFVMKVFDLLERHKMKSLFSAAILFALVMSYGYCQENENTNLTIHIINQSLVNDLIDIQINIDGDSVVSDDFSSKGFKTWKKFELSLDEGAHSMHIESTKGDAELEEEFEITGKHWVVVEYLYSPNEGEPGYNKFFPPEAKKLAFAIADEPIFFE